MNVFSFESVKPYVLRYLHQHYWRVQNLLSFDDTVGEAQLQFWRTIKRLQDRGCVIENEKHLMALFKTSWTRHFATLSTKSSQQIQTISFQASEELQWLEQNSVGDLDNDAFINLLIETAPDDVRQVLMTLLKIPPSLFDKITDLVQQQKVEAANQIMSNLLGCTDQQNLLQKTINYLSN